jgi:hypothetical protein
MTMRQRMLALIQGRDLDRVPFVQYSGLAAGDDEVRALLGPGRIGVLEWQSPFREQTPHCHVESEAITIDDRPARRATMHTPEGALEATWVRGLFAEVTHEHFIREPEDYRVLLCYLRDVEIQPDPESWREVYDRLGEDGLPHTSVARTPWQQLWVRWVSLESLALHAVDEPELMEEVFAALEAVQEQAFKVVADLARELPIPYVVFPDNITAPMIGPGYFRRFCLPAYQRLADLLAETGRDVPVGVHMDGDLKPLAADIAASSVRLLDSFSPPPDNDTSAAEAVQQWPDMRLGLNFPSSVHLQPPEQVRAMIETILGEAGHSGRLQVQISENLPPDRWRVTYPILADAIEGFGRP